MTVQESAEPRLSLRLGPPSVAFPHGYFISAARFRFGQDSAKIRWSVVFSAVFGSTAVLRDDRDADGPVLLESQLGWGEQWSWFYWKKLAGMNVGCVDSQWWERDFVSCCIFILYLMPIAPSSTSPFSLQFFFESQNGFHWQVPAAIFLNSHPVWWCVFLSFSGTVQGMLQPFVISLRLRRRSLFQGLQEDPLAAPWAWIGRIKTCTWDYIKVMSVAVRYLFCPLVIFLLQDLCAIHMFGS